MPPAHWTTTRFSNGCATTGADGFEGSRWAARLFFGYSVVISALLQGLTQTVTQTRKRAGGYRRTQWMPHRAESMQKRRKVLRSNAFRRSSYLHTQEVTGSSPAVSTTYEKSELVPHEERVRIFHLYQRYFLLLFKPGGRENPPGLSFYLHIGFRSFLPLQWLRRIIGGRSRRASRAPSRRLRNISPAPPAAGPAAATRAGTAPAAEGSGMHSCRYP